MAAADTKQMQQAWNSGSCEGHGTDLLIQQPMSSQEIHPVHFVIQSVTCLCLSPIAPRRPQEAENFRMSALDTLKTGLSATNSTSRKYKKSRMKY
jgi:hypothetical protein